MSMNLYLEVVESGTGKNSAILKRTPGVSLFTTITGANGPVRGLWAGENRLFCVAGNALYEVFQDGTFTNRSALSGATTLGSATTGPVGFAANGNQLLVVAGGQVYCDNGSGPVLVQFNDGTGACNTFVPTGVVTTSNVGGVFTATVTSGSNFGQIQLGGVIIINLKLYTVTAIDSTTTVATLNKDPGNNTGLGWSANLAVWADGDYFTQISPGDLIDINSQNYIVFSVDPTATILTLKGAITAQSNVLWSAWALGGTVAPTPNGSGGSILTLKSGDAFDTRMTSITLVSPLGTTLGTYSVTNVTSSSATIAGTVLSPATLTYAANIPITGAGCAFFDTYFVVFLPNSKTIQISANNDGTTWSPLDYATKEGYPDNIAAILCDHEQLWIQGDEDASEIWDDTGNANFPLQRVSGGFIQYANLAPQTLCRFNNGIAWLGGDEVRGGPAMFFSQSAEPVRISNHAVETAWSKYSTVYDAIAFPYIEDGHHFLVVIFPTANAVWCYDATASQQTQVAQWHQRGYNPNNRSTSDAVANGTTTISSATAAFTSAITGTYVMLANGTGSLAPTAYLATYSSPTAITVPTSVPAGTGITLAIPGCVSMQRQLQSTHAYVQGSLTSTNSGGSPGSKSGASAHYVGDATAYSGDSAGHSGALIYIQSEQNLSDNGVPIVRVRTCPHLGTEDVFTFFGPFELLASVNNNTAAPINPVLDYSHDYGVDFVNPQQRTSYNSALPNPLLTRMIWRRGGKDRDRVNRLTISDVADFALIDAYYDASVGGN